MRLIWKPKFDKLQLQQRLRGKLVPAKLLCMIAAVLLCMSAPGVLQQMRKALDKLRVGLVCAVCQYSWFCIVYGAISASPLELLSFATIFQAGEVSEDKGRGPNSDDHHQVPDPPEMVLNFVTPCVSQGVPNWVLCLGGPGSGGGGSRVGPGGPPRPQQPVGGAVMPGWAMLLSALLLMLWLMLLLMLLLLFLLLLLLSMLMLLWVML